MLRCPALLDPSFPATARYHEAHEKAVRLAAAEPGSWLTVQAVDDLERAWRQAVLAAEQVGLTTYSRAQRVRIHRGYRLLAQASSDRGAPQLRMNQYFTALRLLDGLITLPAALQAELRTAAARRIEPTGTPGPINTYW